MSFLPPSLLASQFPQNSSGPTVASTCLLINDRESRRGFRYPSKTSLTSVLDLGPRSFGVGLWWGCGGWVCARMMNLEVYFQSPWFGKAPGFRPQAIHSLALATFGNPHAVRTPSQVYSLRVANRTSATCIPHIGMKLRPCHAVEPS